MRRPKSILLVEDDRDDAQFFSEVLRGVDSKVSCTVTANGYETLKLLKTIRVIPRLIFTDLNMPMMNGFEFLKLIKQEELLRHIPVVVLTSSKADAEKCYALGANLYITKPALTEEFHDMLSKVLSHDLVQDEKMLRGFFSCAKAKGR